MFKSWPVITTLAVLGLTNFASVALSASAENDGIVRVASAVPIEEAAKRIKQAVAEKGIEFFSEIDQADLAAKAGIKLRPWVLLVLVTRRLERSSSPPTRMPASIGPYACCSRKTRAARFGRFTPTSAGLPSATESQTGTISSKWQQPSFSQSRRPWRPSKDARRTVRCCRARRRQRGIAVTGPTRAAGMSVALVEDRELGGTCPNRGCTPKKVLVAAGHALHEIGRANSPLYLGVEAGTRLGGFDRP